MDREHEQLLNGGSCPKAGDNALQASWEDSISSLSTAESTILGELSFETRYIKMCTGFCVCGIYSPNYLVNNYSL